MVGNLFKEITPAGAEEEVRTLAALPGARVERIVSTGQSSPPGFWYDQPAAEWVLLLAGGAAVRFEDEAAARPLKPGDHLLIAPHRRHRVDWTSPDEPTVWLAVHGEP
jgi:cupin 2 domain-containing protein